jgi:hypothetical protein
VGAAAVWSWQGESKARSLNYTKRAFISIALLFLLVGNWNVIRKTQELVRETGGRGRWSKSLDRFCQINQLRSDLTIVSLDWGFNEQLLFLTDGPSLVEPFWNWREGLRAMPTGAQYVYLVHPPEYTQLPYGLQYLNAAEVAGDQAEIEPWYDDEHQITFYAIRVPRP